MTQTKAERSREGNTRQAIKNKTDNILTLAKKKKKTTETEKQIKQCIVFSLIAGSILEFLVPELSCYFFSKFLVFNSVLSVLIQCFSCDVITFKVMLICELQQCVKTNNCHNVISKKVKQSHYRPGVAQRVPGS